jgi:uncharacterized membrane protein YqjE
MRDRTRNIITVVTTLLVIYVIAVRLEATLALVFALFILTTVGLWWMVYTILTDTTNLSGKTFDEYFYEDGNRRD